MNTDNIKTEFNSNLATLMRIDDALKLARRSMLEDDYNLWFKALRTLKNEAIVKMNDEQKAKCKDWIHQLEKKIALYYNTKGEKSSFNTKIDNHLDEFEEYLRGIMDKKGMLLSDNAPDLMGI